MLGNVAAPVFLYDCFAASIAVTAADDDKSDSHGYFSKFMGGSHESGDMIDGDGVVISFRDSFRTDSCCLDIR